jgi:hypothetical protein
MSDDTVILAVDSTPDESCHSHGHPYPSVTEAFEGQRLGERIDTDNDEDSGVVMIAVDAERLIGYLVEKHRQPYGATVESIVATTVADVLLVVEGVLTIDDFAPRRNR